jgi:hypothetical protein
VWASIFRLAVKSPISTLVGLAVKSPISTLVGLVGLAVKSPISTLVGWLPVVIGFALLGSFLLAAWCLYCSYD